MFEVPPDFYHTGVVVDFPKVLHGINGNGRTLYSTRIKELCIGREAATAKPM